MPSPLSTSSAYVFDELSRLSRVVSQPASLSSFQQLRRSLGDDAAFVVMDYFIDIRTLHDQCVELKSYGVDRHAAVLRALLLRADLATPVSVAARSSPDVQARSAQLIAACHYVPFQDIIIRLPDLLWTLQWPADTATVTMDCLMQTVCTPDVRGARVERLFYGGDMRSITVFLNLSRRKFTQPAFSPMSAIKAAMFTFMAHAYYHVWQVPHTVRCMIDVKEIYASVSGLPLTLRQSMSPHEQQLLGEAGFY